MVSYVCRSGPIYVLVVFVAVVAVTVVVDTGVFDVTAITDEFDVVVAICTFSSPPHSSSSV